MAQGEGLAGRGPTQVCALASGLGTSVAPSGTAGSLTTSALNSLPICDLESTPVLLKAHFPCLRGRDEYQPLLAGLLRGRSGDVHHAWRVCSE